MKPMSRSMAATICLLQERNRIRQILEHDIYEEFIVYKKFRLSKVHHPRPFNKSKRGQMRRAEKLFKQRGKGYEPD